jgi:hypothetical protein
MNHHEHRERRSKHGRLGAHDLAGVAHELNDEAIEKTK